MNDVIKWIWIQYKSSFLVPSSCPQVSKSPNLTSMDSGANNHYRSRFFTLLSIKKTTMYDWDATSHLIWPKSCSSILYIQACSREVYKVLSPLQTLIPLQPLYQTVNKQSEQTIIKLVDGKAKFMELTQYRNNESPVSRYTFVSITWFKPKLTVTGSLIWWQSSFKAWLIACPPGNQRVLILKVKQRIRYKSHSTRGHCHQYQDSFS